MFAIYIRNAYAYVYPSIFIQASSTVQPDASLNACVCGIKQELHMETKEEVRVEKNNQKFRCGLVCFFLFATALGFSFSFRLSVCCLIYILT